MFKNVVFCKNSKSTKLCVFRRQKLAIRPGDFFVSYSLEKSSLVFDFLEKSLNIMNVIDHNIGV